MDDYTELFYENNCQTWRSHFARRKLLLYTNLSSPRVAIALLKYRRDCRKHAEVAQKNRSLARVLAACEHRRGWVRHKVRVCKKDDARVQAAYGPMQKTIDYSDPNKKDYYSVLTIVKNEARYIQEFILFYQATGADRIYIYDNDSSDHLMDVIEPYIQSGLVIYTKWPGEVVQTAAYRDAFRRTAQCTKWMAVVDADEFLYSPKGNMKEQLRQYEAFPGVCANWITFGPNGHEKRPEGLVMDNYTKALSWESVVNCHVKSIVQPARVACMYHTHYAVYKHGEYAVDEEKVPVDHTHSYIPVDGRAFTEKNKREIFRINHYVTRSMEDLLEKCSRGCGDQTGNKKIEGYTRMFEGPQVEDYTIKPYADMVRRMIYGKD